MLIIYNITTGAILDNTGTSDQWPEGPPDELAYVNIDNKNIPREDVALLRLHDEDDAVLIQQLLTHEYSIDITDGSIVVGAPHPMPEPDNTPTLEDRIVALETEITNMKARAEQAQVTGDAATVRDAITGQT